MRSSTFAVALSGALAITAIQELTAQGEVIDACVQKSSRQVRVVDASEACRAAEVRVTWSVQGAPGEAGAAGPGGPAGPAGPAGPPGTTLVFTKRWAAGSQHPCCSQWWPIPGSEVTATTTGGALFISMDLSMVNGSHATCRATIDGQSAASFGGSPDPGTPYWPEGLMAVGCCGGGWRKWSVSRVFTGVPAGSHSFGLQCATDGGTLTVGDPGISSAWSVFEVN